MTDQIPQVLETDPGLLPPLAASATFSPCGYYRYLLRRVWEPELPPVCFVMLNPSTATAFRADATARRVIGFAKRWGHGGVTVVNAFAIRSTDPKAMLRSACPVDPLGRAGDNDRFIVEAARGVKTVVAWGTHGAFQNRDREVLDLLQPLYSMGQLWCLGTTQGGQPRHPLFVAANAELVPFVRKENP